jgi:hypothetical protein
MISLDGDYKAMGNVYNKSLEKMGIDGDSYEKGGTFVYSGGKFVYWSSGKDTFEYQGKMGNTNVSAARIATETEDDWDAQNTKDRLIIGETKLCPCCQWCQYGYLRSAAGSCRGQYQCEYLQRVAAGAL